MKTRILPDVVFFVAEAERTRRTLPADPRAGAGAQARSRPGLVGQRIRRRRLRCAARRLRTRRVHEVQAEVRSVDSLPLVVA